MHRSVQHGRDVRALVRNGSNTAALNDLQNVELIEGDITDLPSLKRAFKGADIVYHCAAAHGMSPRRAEIAWKINVGGTENVIQAAVEGSVRRLVHCSSVDAIGLPESGVPSNETAPWNWDRLGVNWETCRA